MSTTNPDRWKRIDELFAEAADIPDPRARHDFLAHACGEDLELLEEVQSLLDNQSDGAPVFQEAVDDAVVTFAADGTERHESEIGPYRVERKLGEGGMGSVYLAVRDDDHFRKKVALKLMRTGMATPWLIDRFRYERQILATLEHPNIARLLDGGATESGLPYIVMEYVEGEPITTYCTNRKLDLRARLQLFQQVCSAVSYAHKNLIIHRDLKPGNILASDLGGPRLLDFGTAKLLSAQDGGEQQQPGTVARMLTPGYASPEQLRGEPVTTATDVYSLGVILYELLTGKRPYEASTDAVAIERVLTGQEPDPPSHVTAATEPKLTRALRGDLDTIVLTAMRREPERRYGSVDQLSEDIRRHLEGLPIQAQQDTIAYIAAKFVRRNKLAVAAMGIAVFALFAGTGIALWQAHVARQQAARAQQRFADVRSMANTILFDVQDKLRTVPGTMAVRKTLLDTALAHLDKLSNETDDDPSLQYELATAYDRVGRILGNPAEVNAGNTKGAVESARKAVALFDKAILAAPDNEEWLIGASAGHRRLAELLIQNNTAAARVAINRAVEIGRHGAQVGRTKERLDNLRAALTRLAEYQRPAGEKEASIRTSEEALEVAKRLARDFPGPASQRALALGHCAIGFAHLSAGDSKPALAGFLPCRDLRETLISEGHATLSDRRNLALTYAEISHLELEAGNAAAAVTSAQKGLDLLQSGDADAGDARALLDQSFAHTRLGAAYKAVPNLDKARHHFAEAVAIRTRLGSDLATQSRLSSARNELAGVLLETGALSAAREHLEKARAANASILLADPKRSAYLSASIGTHLLLADYFTRIRNWAEARRSAEAALEVATRLQQHQPGSASEVRVSDAHAVLAKAKESSGDPKGALEAYRAALAAARAVAADNPREKRRREELAKAIESLERAKIR
jgi:eukaryotic-like serine/threonine-protein kinase